MDGKLKWRKERRERKGRKEIRVGRDRRIWNREDCSWGDCILRLEMSMGFMVWCGGENIILYSINGVYNKYS
jgi:hypothetical protein